MDCKEPESMDELIYFSRRTLEPKGKAMAWAYKQECPKCKKALMGKPVEKGKIKIRATEYVCPACGYAKPKLEHEKELVMCIKYMCPKCDHEGVGTTGYPMKTYQGVKARVVQCEACGEKIAITKKMKDPKKKGAVDDD
ncbi:hypothetical protein GF367_00745 [Candidatus Woesearchaeota archaeon]|nr:hypothetical protein [Candidatus Woesearchaeota archaeon]